MKKIIFPLITVFLVILMVEMFSFAALSFSKKKWFFRSDTREEQRVVMAHSGLTDPRRATKPHFMYRDILHPYVGFVLDDPTDEDPYGFRNTVSPIQKKDPQKIILAVTGGSVAFQTFDFAVDTLIEELKKVEKFKDKDFVAIRLAAGGFKQPQQLMALNYLLSLGGEFDLLINIDGFNEAALPLSDNVPKNVFPFFPRKWLIRVDLMSDERMIQYVHEGMKIRRLRIDLARIFGSMLFRYSYTLNLVWESMDHFLHVRENKLSHQAESLLQSATSYVASGPSQAYEKEEALFEEIADLWKRSSQQMANLAAANGIQYFHFLQPNQYVPGSKPFSEAEKAEAFDLSHKYREPVEKVYPYLMAAGRELEKANVHYEDLSMIFASNHQTLYVDSCCHLNEEAYKMIAKEIARSIRSKQVKENESLLTYPVETRQ